MKAQVELPAGRPRDLVGSELAAFESLAFPSLAFYATIGTTYATRIADLAWTSSACVTDVSTKVSE